MTTFNDYRVRVRLARRNGNVDVVEKGFKTDEARAAWLDKVDNAGDLVEVLGFSDPR